MEVRSPEPEAEAGCRSGAVESPLQEHTGVEIHAHTHTHTHRVSDITAAVSNYKDTVVYLLCYR